MKILVIWLCRYIVAFYLLLTLIATLIFVPIVAPKMKTLDQPIRPRLSEVLDDGYKLLSKNRGTKGNVYAFFLLLFTFPTIFVTWVIAMVKYERHKRNKRKSK